jgi:predicted HAD superfamily phosphohydrolase
VLDVANDRDLNASMPDDSKRVPFTNMIYVGDGLSDVPCMKMMRSYGGQAIAVYQPESRTAVEELLQKGRVDFIFPADYREGTALDTTVKNILRRMAITDALTEENERQLRSIGQGILPYQETLFE